MRSPDQPANASFAMLCAVSIIATLFHVLMDLPTSYGTRVLSPFAWHWFAVDWMPIIDVYLLTILIGGAFAGLVSEPSRRRNQAIVFTLMATVYGVRAIAHREALEIAPELFGRALPPRCDPEAPIDAGLVRWPRDAHARARPGDKRCLVDMAALPTFISPFRWTIVAQFSNAYELHDVDLLDSRLQQPATPIERFLRLTIRYPDVWLPVVHVAAQTALAQRFLGFSRFPAARSAVDERTGVTTVRWTDMRFVRAPLTQAARRGNLFTATIRIDRDGHVVDEHLGP
jgi:hypothetical protein